MNPIDRTTATVLDTLASDAMPPEVIAPSEAEWDGMNPAQRDAVERALPFIVEHDFMSEGDIHAGVVIDATDALSNHFGGGGGGDDKRRFYIGRSVMVHYPAVVGFAPDFFVVFDVDNHPRDTWFVSREGRGLDIAFEVIWKGDSRKDYGRNVKQYGELGIPEYFIFDITKQRISGYRLDETGHAYRPILGQLGRFESKVLGLSIQLWQGQFRFFVSDALLPTNSELISGLRSAANVSTERAQAEAERAQAEAERAQALSERVEAEAERAQAAEARVRELEALLATMRGRTDA
jgi:hypothetical protein